VKKQEPDDNWLKEVWQSAKERIREADQVVLIGYSFPPSDINIRSTFKDWLNTNSLLSSVVVVDPKANDAQFRKPFDEIFGYAGRITYCQRTFSRWFLEQVAICGLIGY
jgi:hypothetical protein